jgi:ATP-dependent Lon protease
VIIPDENEKDLAEIPKNVTESLSIRPVRWIDEVLDIALERPLTPSTSTKVEDAAKAASDAAPKEPVVPTPVRPH